MKRLFINITLMLCVLSISAQDSIPRRQYQFSDRLVHSTCIGVPLFVAGILEKPGKEHFRDLRNDFVPDYHNEIDNYIQYAPAVLPIVLKACGAENNSSWGKMLTAEATSFGFVTLFAQGIKRTANERRPDGTRHSFPSGHTASAFMSATILTKEYGHYGPWVGIGAYSLATTTGVMRMLNNRHWISDVVSGAGIGLVSTEFGYWLSDVLFPNEKSSYNPYSLHICDHYAAPSFLGVITAYSMPLNNKCPESLPSVKATTGATFGIEGAGYLNRYLGIGGRAVVSDMRYETDHADYYDTDRSFSLMAGPYVNIHMVQRLFAEGKLLAGVEHYSDSEICGHTFQSKTAASALAGVGLGLRASTYLDVKASIDYMLSPSHLSAGSTQQNLLFTTSANIRF